MESQAVEYRALQPVENKVHGLDLKEVQVKQESTNRTASSFRGNFVMSPQVRKSSRESKPSSKHVQARGAVSELRASNPFSKKQSEAIHSMPQTRDRSSGGLSSTGFSFANKSSQAFKDSYLAKVANKTSVANFGGVFQVERANASSGFETADMFKRKRQPRDLHSRNAANANRTCLLSPNDLAGKGLLEVQGMRKLAGSPEVRATRKVNPEIQNMNKTAGFQFLSSQHGRYSNLAAEPQQRAEVASRRTHSHTTIQRSGATPSQFEMPSVLGKPSSPMQLRNEDQSTKLPSFGDSSAVNCQQQILRRLKEQQRMKLASPTLKQQALECGDLSDIAKAIQEQAKANKARVHTGSKFGRSAERNPRPVEDIMYLSSTDFGVSYKEVSELGKIMTEGQERMMKLKTNKNLDINVLESWINDTLREAEFIQVPGCISKSRQGEGPAASGKQSICMEYGIDRLTLNNSGISNDSINQLYRQFFVTTVGFFSNIKTLIEQQSNSHTLRLGVEAGGREKKANEVIDAPTLNNQEVQKRHKTKASLLSSIWRVYGVLMEYAYANDYKLYVQNIQEENEQKLAETQEKISEMMKKEEAKQNILRVQLKDNQEELRLTQEKLRHTENELRKTTKELNKFLRTHEEEVMLRMKIEEKLNNLHSLNRSFYQNVIRSKNTLGVRDDELKDLYKKFDESQDLVQNVKAEREQLDQWKIIAEEKLQYNENEIKALQELAKDLQDQNTQVNNENLDFTKQLRYQNEEIIIQKDEITELKQQLKEKQGMEKKLRSLCENQRSIISQNNSKLFDQTQRIQNMDKQLTQVTQAYKQAKKLKQDFEAENKQFSKDLSATQKRLREVENDLEFTSHQLQITKDEMEAAKVNFEDSVVKVSKLDEDRNALLAEQKSLQTNINILDTKIIDLTAIQDSLKEANQKMETELLEFESKHNELKKQFNAKRLELDSLKKTTGDVIKYLETKVENLNAKIHKMQGILQAEEKKNQIANETLNANRQIISQQTNKLTFLKCDLENKEEEIEQLEQVKQRLIKQNNDYIKQQENLKKNLLVANQTNEFFEEDKLREVKAVQDRFDAYLKQAQVDQMYYEDIMSLHIRSQGNLNHMRNHQQYLEFKISEQAVKINRFDEEMDRRDHVNSNLRIEKQKVLEKNEMLNVEIFENRLAQKRMEEELDLLKKEKSTLENDLASRDKKIAELFQQVDSQKRLIKVIGNQNKNKRHAAAQYDVHHYPYKEAVLLAPAPESSTGRQSPTIGTIGTAAQATVGDQQVPAAVLAGTATRATQETMVHKRNLENIVEEGSTLDHGGTSVRMSKQHGATPISEFVDQKTIRDRSSGSVTPSEQSIKVEIQEQASLYFFEPGLRARLEQATNLAELTQFSYWERMELVSQHTQTGGRSRSRKESCLFDEPVETQAKKRNFVALEEARQVGSSQMEQRKRDSTLKGDSMDDDLEHYRLDPSVVHTPRGVGSLNPLHETTSEEIFPTASSNNASKSQISAKVIGAPSESKFRDTAQKTPPRKGAVASKEIKLGKSQTFKKPGCTCKCHEQGTNQLSSSPSPAPATKGSHNRKKDMLSSQNVSQMIAGAIQGVVRRQSIKSTQRSKQDLSSTALHVTAQKIKKKESQAKSNHQVDSPNMPASPLVGKAAAGKKNTFKRRGTISLDFQAKQVIRHQLTTGPSEKDKMTNKSKGEKRRGSVRNLKMEVSNMDHTETPYGEIDENQEFSNDTVSNPDSQRTNVLQNANLQGKRAKLPLVQTDIELTGETKQEQAKLDEKRAGMSGPSSLASFGIDVTHLNSNQSPRDPPLTHQERGNLEDDKEDPMFQKQETSGLHTGQDIRDKSSTEREYSKMYLSSMVNDTLSKPSASPHPTFNSPLSKAVKATVSPPVVNNLNNNRLKPKPNIRNLIKAQYTRD